MTNTPDTLRTPAMTQGRGGGLLATLLVSTLSVAAMLPGLALQGVATRPRPGATDDEAVPDEPGAPRRAGAERRGGGAGKQRGADVNGRARANGRATADAGTAVEDGAAEPGRRPRRINDRPAMPGARAGAGEAATVEDEAAAAPAPGRTRDGDEQALTGVADTHETQGAGSALVPTGQAGVAEAASVVDEAADLAPREPITFAEVQAAHAEAAKAFRDARNSLNEAYRIIGRLNVERYQAQYELAKLQGLPLPERPPDRSWNAGVRAPAPTSPKPARIPQRNRRVDEEEDEVDEEEVRAIGRRRRLIVLVSVAAVGLFVLLYWLSDWHWFPNLLDRQALAEMAGIGVFMQVFFLVFFIFRLGTMTGRSKSWLFPTPEAEAWKRRRKRVRGH